MTKMLFRSVGLFVMVLVLIVVIISATYVIRFDIAKNSLANNELIVMDSLPNVYDGLRIIAYGCSGGTLQTTKLGKHCRVIITNQEGSDDLIDQIVYEGDLITVNGYEITIRKIELPLLPAEQGYLILTLKLQ